MGIGVSAAVVVGGIFWGMHTPALAENTPRLLENIPILRGIFTSMQEDMCFSGDYDSIGEEVYMDSKTINGLTVTLAEVYCNDQALYISFTMESENVLPDTDILNCLTVYATGEFSYWEHAHHEGADRLEYTDGTATRVDDHTLAGIMRFDLQRTKVDEAEIERTLAAKRDFIERYEVTEKPFNEIPENFTMELSINYIRLWEEGNGLDNFKDFAGPWTFALDVNKNISDIQVIETGVNEDGIGFEKIVKDRFEIVMYDTAPVELARNPGYTPIMLDANGEMFSHSCSLNVVAIADHDISHVDAFMISDEIWFNELKPLYWNSHKDGTYDGAAFREMMLEQSEYHQEIEFEE